MHRSTARPGVAVRAALEHVGDQHACRRSARARCRAGPARATSNLMSCPILSTAGSSSSGFRSRSAVGRSRICVRRAVAAEQIAAAPADGPAARSRPRPARAPARRRTARRAIDVRASSSRCRARRSPARALAHPALQRRLSCTSSYSLRSIGAIGGRRQLGGGGERVPATRRGPAARCRPRPGAVRRAAVRVRTRVASERNSFALQEGEQRVRHRARAGRSASSGVSHRHVAASASPASRLMPRLLGVAIRVSRRFGCLISPARASSVFEVAIGVDQLGRGLDADAGHARHVVGGIAGQRLHVDDLVRRRRRTSPAPRRGRSRLFFIGSSMRDACRRPAASGPCRRRRW